MLLCTHLRVADLATDPRFAVPSRRSVNRATLGEALLAAFVEHDGNEIDKTLTAIGLPCAPVLSVDGAGNSRTPPTYRTMPPVDCE